jgi:malonyl-CoA/methylmalonyl-CoA synthetase
MGVPTYYVRLLQEKGLTREAVAHMRLFISGSAPLLPETFSAFRERTGQTLLERYGMTEGGMFTSNPLEGERRAGTVGFPLPDVALRITGEEGQVLPRGEVGIIEVKGPNIFKGYWNMPEKTKADFTPDGFFKSGDVGVIDEKGYVSIVGRAKGRDHLPAIRALARAFLQLIGLFGAEGHVLMLENNPAKRNCTL